MSTVTGSAWRTAAARLGGEDQRVGARPAEAARAAAGSMREERRRAPAPGSGPARPSAPRRRPGPRSPARGRDLALGPAAHARAAGSCARRRRTEEGRPGRTDTALMAFGVLLRRVRARRRVSRRARVLPGPERARDSAPGFRPSRGVGRLRQSTRRGRPDTRRESRGVAVHSRSARCAERNGPEGLLTCKTPCGSPSPRGHRPAPVQRESFRTLFANHPHPTWVFALDDLRFLEVNEAAIRRYGYSRDEFLALKITDIRPGRTCRGCWIASRRRAAQAATPPAQSRHRRKDGTLIDVGGRAPTTCPSKARRAMLVSPRTSPSRSGRRRRCARARSATAAWSSCRPTRSPSTARAWWCSQPAAVRLLGYDVAGGDHRPLDHGLRPPRLAAGGGRAHAALLAGGEPVPFVQEKFLRRDGSVIHVEAGARALHLPRPARRAGGHPRHHASASARRRCRRRSTASRSSPRRGGHAGVLPHDPRHGGRAHVRARTSTSPSTTRRRALLSFPYFVDERTTRRRRCKPGKAPHRVRPAHRASRCS